MTATSSDPVRLPRDPMLPAPYRVVERIEESHDTVSLALTSAGPSPTADFSPGQFSMLYAFGVGEAAISISGDPLRRDRLVHTVRAVGATTRALHGARPGTLLGFRGPFCTAWPMAGPPGRDLVIVAGGVGLAPLRPALYQALAHRHLFDRICVLIGTRAERELIFEREFQAWRERGAEVFVTLDTADPSWRGHVGVVTRLIPLAGLRPHQSLAFVCGPEIMMRFAIQSLLDLGMPERAIHLTMERNMKCAVGLCGHCQFGGDFVCKDGPVFPYDRLKGRLQVQGI